MVKVRLWGELEEIEALANLLKQELSIKVLSCSLPYKDRGNSEYFRVYMDLKLKDPDEVKQSLIEKYGTEVDKILKSLNRGGGDNE